MPICGWQRMLEIDMDQNIFFAACDTNQTLGEWSSRRPACGPDVAMRLPAGELWKSRDGCVVNRFQCSMVALGATLMG